MTEQLKHCPFCGNEAIICYNGCGDYWADCSKCFARLKHPFRDVDGSQRKRIINEIITQWNTRNE